MIANYPNQLCYDGKSYAVAYGLPILTDYTVIADRTWFAEKVDNGVFLDLILKISGGNLFVKIGYRHCFYNGRIDNIIYLSYY